MRAFAFCPYLSRIALACICALFLSKAKAVDKNDEGPISIQAEQIKGNLNSVMKAQCDVILTRGTSKINADEMAYDHVKNSVDAQGNIVIHEKENRYTGNTLHFLMDDSTGELTKPTYSLSQQIKGGHGVADKILFEGKSTTQVINGTYTTCLGPDPDWYLKAGSLTLDSDLGKGIARSPVIYFKGIPILAAPMIHFPTSNARQSGVLPPTLGFNSKSGLTLALPYYFNIAPNRDLTFTPNLISRRGLQLGTDGRYLGNSYSGESNFEYLAADRQYGGKARYAYQSNHQQNFSNGVSYGWNVAGASDDDYPNDFSGSAILNNQRLLNRQFNVSYTASNWYITGLASDFQVLQDPLSPITKSYSRLPQIHYHYGKNESNGLFWSIDSEYTNFRLPVNDLKSQPTPYQGNRFILNPKISYTWLTPGAFITPAISLHSIGYDVINPFSHARNDDSLFVPSFTIDSGLIFERDTAIFGSHINQTLEPRIFYNYTPYHNQDTLPNFDTGDIGFGYSQIFSDNRFVGSDRVGDANQVTLGLFSRFFEANGVERLKIGFAKRFNFSPIKIFLNPKDPNNDPNRNDLLFLANGQLTNTLSLYSNLQFNLNQNRSWQTNVNISWKPLPKHVLNAGYNFVRDSLDSNGLPLDQYNISGQWPLSQGWYGVGSVSFTRKDQRISNGLLGLEYQSGCWVLRVAAQRITTATDVYNTNFFFQLELNGMGKLGTNPIPALQQNIPGYQIVNTP